MASWLEDQALELRDKALELAQENVLERVERDLVAMV